MYHYAMSKWSCPSIDQHSLSVLRIIAKMDTNLNEIEKPHRDWGGEPGPVAVERCVWRCVWRCSCLVTQMSTTGALIVVDSYGLFTVTGINK